MDREPRESNAPPEGISQEDWEKLVQLWIEAPHYHEFDASQMRALLVGLSRECPFGGNPANCCMHAIRKIPFKERVERIMKLSDGDMQVIYNQHLHCSRCRTRD